MTKNGSIPSYSLSYGRDRFHISQSVLCLHSWCVLVIVAPNGYHGLLNMCGNYDGTETNIKYKWNTTEDIYKSKSTTQYVQYATYKP